MDSKKKALILAIVLGLIYITIAYKKWEIYGIQQ